MKDRPLKFINPFTLARQAAELQGSLALAGMDALTPLLDSSEGNADYHLGFSLRGRRVFVDGRISAVVGLVCQRCDHEFQDQIVTETHLQVVMNDDQALQVAEPYEPLLVGEDHCVRLIDLIQEEIILALPMFAKHPDGECPAVPA